MVRLTDRPDITLDVYRRRKTTIQQQQQPITAGLRPDLTSKLVHGLAFRTFKCYIASFGKIKRCLINLSYNCDVKSGLKDIDD